MPVIRESTFKTPLYFSNRHLQTIYPSLIRKVDDVVYQREKFTLKDGDFIDLDYSRVGSEKLLIVLHGLEGSADRPYVKGMVKIFNKEGWDAMGINFRGCSGVPNLLPQTYHSGKTDDLDEVIESIDQSGVYKRIALVGFSLGGNVCLKYVGEKGKSLSPNIKNVIAFSAPVHLESASIELAKWYNYIYMKRFMVNLKNKVRDREDVLRDFVDLERVYRSKSFLDFDDAFTAPIHGFESAVDYWTKSSSKQFLENINVPALLVNAKDDSFLSEQCYPFKEAEALNNFFLETPEKGGHVGFINKDEQGQYWSERRALKFITETH